MNVCNLLSPLGHEVFVLMLVVKSMSVTHNMRDVLPMLDFAFSYEEKVDNITFLTLLFAVNSAVVNCEVRAADVRIRSRDQSDQLETSAIE